MKQIDILGKLFGSAIRVKLLKYFLLNDEGIFTLEEISKVLRIQQPLLRPEIKLFLTLGIIKDKMVTRTFVGKRKTTKKKVVGYSTLKAFPLLEPLRNLISESKNNYSQEIPHRFGHTGKITLCILSGVFLKDPERMVDLLIVGDKLDKELLEQEVGKFEADMGRELRYAFFDTEEFLYRMKMYDKLLRDILDYPHEKVINKLAHPDLLTS